MALVIEQVVLGKTYKINGTSTGSRRFASELSSDTISLTISESGQTSRYKTTNNFADFTIGGVSPTDVDDAVSKINAIVNFSSAGGLGGTALSTTTDISNFDGNLSPADTDVQKALDTIDDLPIGGEINTAANAGAGGVSMVSVPDKVGFALQFNSIKAASSKVTVALDGPNKEVDLDVDEAAINHNALLNYAVEQHRIINDNSSTTTELLSASKILSLIGALGVSGQRKGNVVTSTEGLGNITLSGEQTLNGVLTSVSRVHVHEQTLPAENGPYLTGAGAWVRTSDANSDSLVNNGMTTYVEDPASTFYNAFYVLVTADPITVGVTGLVFDKVDHSFSFGTTAGTATEGNDPRVLTQDENDAGQGTFNAPSNTNRFVTFDDPTNTDARPPTAHAASHKHGGGDEVATATPAANEIPKTGAGGTLADGFLSPNIPRKDNVNIYTKQQYFAETTLAYAANIDWDLDSNEATKVTLTGNAVLNSPTGMAAGGSHALTVIQGGTGSYTLGYAANYRTSLDTSIPFTRILPTAVGSSTVISFYCNGTIMVGP